MVRNFLKEKKVLIELFSNAAQIEFLLGFLSIAYSILYYSCRGLFLFHFNWTVHCCSLIQFHSPSIYLKTCSAGKSTWNWAAERLGAEVSCIRLYLTEKMTIEKKIIFQKKCGWLHQIWRDPAANGFHKEKQSSAFLSFCCSVRELSKLSARLTHSVCSPITVRSIQRIGLP